MKVVSRLTACLFLPTLKTPSPITGVLSFPRWENIWQNTTLFMVINKCKFGKILGIFWENCQIVYCWPYVSTRFRTGSYPSTIFRNPAGSTTSISLPHFAICYGISTGPLASKLISSPSSSKSIISCFGCSSTFMKKVQVKPVRVTLKS